MSVDNLTEGAEGGDLLEDKFLEDRFEKLCEGPNHHFVEHGIDGESAAADPNLKIRRFKEPASSAFSLVGTAVALTGHTAGVNVANVAKHGAAAASSSLHLVKLHGMANKVKDGGSLAHHLQMLINLKSVKATHRLGQTITSAVPGVGLSQRA